MSLEIVPNNGVKFTVIDSWYPDLDRPSLSGVVTTTDFKDPWGRLTGICDVGDAKIKTVVFACDVICKDDNGFIYVISPTNFALFHSTNPIVAAAADWFEKSVKAMEEAPD